MAMFSDQLRQVLRRLGRAPLFTAITLITLAVGIGANTVIFSVVEGVLLKPLPYPHPEQLIGVWHTAPGIDIKDLNMSPSDLLHRPRAEHDPPGHRRLRRRLAQRDRRGRAGACARPRRHRRHAAAARREAGARTPVHAARTTRRARRKPCCSPTDTGSRNSAARLPSIGRSITVDGKPREIIGVLPQGFHFLDEQDACARSCPCKWDRSKTKLGNFSYEALARLKPGVTMAQASADMARLLPDCHCAASRRPTASASSLFEKAQFAPEPAPAEAGRGRRYRQRAVGADGLDRPGAAGRLRQRRQPAAGARRRTPPGIGHSLRARRGMGTHRGGAALRERHPRHCWAALIGLALAYGALRVLVAMAPTGLPRIHEIGIDLPVLLFTLAHRAFLQPADRRDSGLQVRRART